MGAYFGLVNCTKKHGVSSYWKNAPPSIHELKAVMAEFGWSTTDDIRTWSYADAYIYRNGRWKEWSEDDVQPPFHQEEWTYTGTSKGAKFDGTFFCN